MNTAVFAGRVGTDAELNYTKSGKAVASFSIAIDNGKDQDGNKREATWIKAVLWEKKAEASCEVHLERHVGRRLRPGVFRSVD